MATEKGIIEKISHSDAVVRIQKSSACAHCESRGACQVSEGKAMLIEVANDLQAKVNDHVEISVPEGSLLKLSFLVYFVPILALIAGALGGSVLAPSSSSASAFTAVPNSGATSTCPATRSPKSTSVTSARSMTAMWSFRRWGPPPLARWSLCWRGAV